MYESILAATDGSEGARRAVDRAIELASLFNATLHLLYVVDTQLFAADTPSEAREELLADVEGEGESVLADLETAAADAGVRLVERSLRRGVPHQDILEAAEAVSAELVVLGSYGEGGFDGDSLGSTAAAVARGSDQPILLV